MNRSRGVVVFDNGKSIAATRLSRTFVDLSSIESQFLRCFTRPTLGCANMNLASQILPSTTFAFWIRYGIVLLLAILAWNKMRTPLVACTAMSVCIAGLAASYCQSEYTAMLILLVGLTLGLAAGLFADTFSTHDRRMQCAIERMYASKYVCPQCDHGFTSTQLTGQCPRCECRFPKPEQPKCSNWQTKRSAKYQPGNDDEP